MKFLCNTKELSVACNNVMRAVSTKDTIPTIGGILIECDSNKLSLVGYDFEFGINTIIDVEMEEAGSIVINAKVLCDIINKLADENVTIETNGTSVSIISGAAHYNITGIDANDYPELPGVNNGTSITFDQGIIYSMVSQTIFAVADSESGKPVYTGIKFDIKNDEFTMIGVDGFRLAIRKEKINYASDELEFIVPKKTIRELIKLFDGKEENKLNINVGKRHIIFEIGNYSIISRLLEGDFIDYKTVIQNAINTTVLINTKDAISCIQRTLPVIENNQKNPIRCLFDNDEMRVSTVSSLGRFVDYTHANTSGERVEIGFNSKFMLDALNASDTDEVKIEISGPVSPVKIMPMTGDSFLFLVLPMRLRNEN
ncbi:MAG: DNA polymerase III subunit beta [Eubacterium sp.]|nr:DNA polymerase III subunit beta [Eubacterium sp.]